VNRPANDTWPYPKTWAGYLRYPDRGQFGETAGLYDAGARLYAPTWGQFLEGDPVLPEADVPETWGRYAYGGGDTVGRWDPDGRFAWLISGGIGAAIGGGLGFAACALQGGDDCLSAAGIGAAAGFVSGATFGLAQMAGAGAIAAGAASGGAGGAISGGATAWKNGGDAGDIARAALIHGLGGALGGGIAGRFGVSTATMGAGRALVAEVTGNVAGELAAQSVSVAFGQSSGVDCRSVAVSAAIGSVPSVWRAAAGVGWGAHHETPSARVSAGAVGEPWRLETEVAVDLSAFDRQIGGQVFEPTLDVWGARARPVAPKRGVAANRLAGQVGERFLAGTYGPTSHVTLKTTLGRRVVDDSSGGVARESKVGLTSLRSSIRKQIATDVELMSAPGRGVTSVEWHFFPSGTEAGPTALLQNAPSNAGIGTVIH
jgi:RHS repeat-associated protein